MCISSYDVLYRRRGMDYQEVQGRLEVNGRIIPQWQGALDA